MTGSSISQDFAKATAPKSAKRYPAPFSLRLTLEERERLVREARGVPLGVYIRSRLFDAAASPRRSVRRPTADQQGLARTLAALGDSRLSSNLNQIAKAANMGVLPVTPELENELAAACNNVRAMRAALMEALGLKPGGLS